MRSFRWILILCTAAAMAQTSKIGGDYAGTLGPLHLKLHLKAAAGGAIEGTLDSLDQGAMGLPCANFQVDGSAFSFEVPSVGGKWHGKISEDGATLTGSWSQGQEIPVSFHREEAVEPPDKPSPVDGIWLGTLLPGSANLRIQLQVKSDRSGKFFCTADSIDQGAMGLACENVQLSGHAFSFELPAVKGKWSGTLAENGNDLDGTWTQGKPLALRFTRQQSLTLPKAPEPPKYDDAMPPVPVDGVKAVLDRDLSAALKDGALAPATAGGIVIGVVQHGVRRIFTYGPVKEDSIFEIGSITKTFTALMLAQMVEQHKVTLDEPVRALLPDGTLAKPEGPEITLLDLAMQRSGLPRLPDNLDVASRDPYAKYRPANLYQYLAKRGVARPADAPFLYSNLGLGLLGQALANRAGMSYPELLKALVTAPLGLADTGVKLSPEQEKRFVEGHNAQHQTTPPWNFDALAGAGAIRSTVGDLLSYLEAQLHPDRTKGTLPAALALCQELRADVPPKMKIGLAWLHETDTGNYWHDGGTGGYSSYAFFNPQGDYGAVVLFNTTLTTSGSFADNLGMHIAQRMSGKPAIMLHD